MQCLNLQKFKLLMHTAHTMHVGPVSCFGADEASTYIHAEELVGGCSRQSLVILAIYK